MSSTKPWVFVFMRTSYFVQRAQKQSYLVDDDDDDGNDGVDHDGGSINFGAHYGGQCTQIC